MVTDEKSIIFQLKKIFHKNDVLTDEKSKLIYGRDLTQNFTPNPLAIVFPKSEQEIIKLVHFANSTMTSLVPSAGRTGYSGGAVANNKEIIVSFEKMNRIIRFNSEDKNITSEPGVTVKT